MLEVCSADVVGIDAGTPPAFLLAMRRPDLVRRLVVMESLLGGLPGAEAFLAQGVPWWFGFHAVPGLAETVLTGHEARYVGARPVGRALERQLGPVADRLVGHVIEDCGHIIPLHRPGGLLRLLEPFLAPGPPGLPPSS